MNVLQRNFGIILKFSALDKFNIYAKKRMRIILITFILFTIYLGKCAPFVAHFDYERISTRLRLNCTAIFVGINDNLVDLTVSKDKRVFYHYNFKSQPGNSK